MVRAERLSLVAMRWLVLGEWRAHPVRVVLGAFAIAVGVALGFAVHLINASALNEFSKAVSSVNGAADLQIRSVSNRGFDERLYSTISHVPGIATASPVVELAVEPVDKPLVKLTVLGLDVLRAASVTPMLLGRRAAEAPEGSVFDTDAVYLSDTAMVAVGGHIGDRLALSLPGGAEASFTIVGRLPAVPAGQSLAVIDIAAAQWRFDRLRRLQRLDLRLSEGAEITRVRREVAALLPPDAELVSRDSEERRSDALSRAYRVNLDMLALVALLTGGFLVYSAQALSIARRRPQFALLRVLGVARRALILQILTEGLIVGAAGAIAGLVLGLGLASAALTLLGGDLGGGYFSGVRPELTFAPGAALLFLVLGLLSALLGSLLPAVDTARGQPAITLKNAGDAIDPDRRTSPLVALGLLGAGGVAALLPALAGLPLFGYLAMALILAGGVAAMPWFARFLLHPIRNTGFGLIPLDLAVKRLWGAPSQAAVALCGIVASTSLMIAMAVMVSSFRGSVDDWLGQILSADLYLRLNVTGPDAGFDPALRARLASVPGVGSVQFLRMSSLSLTPDRPPIVLIARSVDRADPATSLPLIGASLPVPEGKTPVWVSEPAAWLYDLHPGRLMTLPLAAPDGSAPSLFIAGEWRDYARQYGSVVLDESDYTRLTGDTGRNEGEVYLAPGADASSVTAAIKAALPEGLASRVDYAAPRSLRVFAMRLFDRSFAVTYLLEVIAIMVGLAGVAATVSAQTLARTKEFGMLRHLGVRRREIVAMVIAEGAMLGAVGGIAGVGLGIAMSQVLIHVVNPQSFHWTMETRLPLGLCMLVIAALIAATAGTARIAGGRALSADAVRAVREDY